jgi:peptidoglycan/LPS O-acetylase OafA/YrhL
MGLAWHALFYMFAVWLVGSLVYFADSRRVGQPEPDRRKARVLVGVGVAALVSVLVAYRLGLLHLLISDSLVGLAFGLALWGLLRDAVAFPGWLRPFARYGATASFSLYVTHFPVFAFVVSAIGHNALRDPDLASFGLIVALSLFAVAVGWLFSRFTEVHTYRLREMIRHRMLPAARG